MRRPSTGHVLVANPSFDVYGADLQMLESVRALRGDGWGVTVVSPTPGPLADRLVGLGAETVVLEYPVLRRADATPRGMVGLAAAAARALPRMRSLVTRTGADAVYVNTVTVPWWLTAARSARRPVLCHVHEAEPGVRRAVQQAISRPLVLADAVVVNSSITLETTCAPVPSLRSRTHLVHNGVAGPPVPPGPAAFDAAVTHLLFVGRVSQRKAPHVALEATAILRSEGHDVRLTVAGTPVPGQEEYRDGLVRRAQEPDLEGAVTFAGYAPSVWPLLERADVFTATSTAEPFGNAVVEAQLALRPVVATAVEGHLETVLEGSTGLHIPVGDAQALAAAVRRLVADPASARAMAERARDRARTDFSLERYGARMVSIVNELAGRR